jgi:PAS domain S-box-containing protein
MHIPNLATDLNTSISLEAQLWESDSRFRAFFNQTTLAVILHDSQGRIIDLNEEADQLYGGDHETMLQMRLADLDPGLAADGFATYWGNGLPDRIHNLSRTHQRRDGTQVPVTVSLGPVTYYGKTLGFMYIQDYTHQAKVESKLRTQARELAMANRYKDEFLESFSHELRTPLNGILMLSAHLANNGEDNLNLQEMSSIKTINKCGRTLSNMINDILDLAKLKSGEIKLRIEPYGLDVLEHSITREFEVALADSTVSYAIDIDPDVPAVIHTDFFKLWQILQNIISNAVKFTHSGSICIRISGSEFRSTPPGPPGDSRPMIAIAVSDTGIGIDPIKHVQIFDAFKQADRSISRRYGGAGLGLSIASSRCDCLGGKIMVESTEGQGSVFTVHIPDQIGAIGNGNRSGLKGETP